MSSGSIGTIPQCRAFSTQTRQELFRVNPIAYDRKVKSFGLDTREHT